MSISPESSDTTCPTCGKLFTSTRALASHIKKHAPAVSCPFCDKPVRYLGPHIDREHAEMNGNRLIREVRELVEENHRLKQENARLKELQDI